MNRIVTLIMLTCGLSVLAHADVWKWVDENGKTHFVDSNTAIYTWVDEIGKRHYADVPGHESAVSIELVWHSKGSLSDLEQQGGDKKSGSNEAYPGETPEERFEREQAEAYYCKRAQEIYESYLNAPRLYKTREDGTRHYLSAEEAEATLAETKAQVDELCG
ncbi:MAG: DUF4124 domain-containing protein [Woeseiaceae bacterium]|nr:DUF4124 domain-containing protein [Woeseiaceae bacterium]